MEKKKPADMENRNTGQEEMEPLNINADENISGTSGLNEPLAEDAEMEKLKAELESLKDKYVRQAAEFDNYRKRTAREYRDLQMTASKEVLQSLLVVLDDSDRAETQINNANDLNAVKEGLQLVFHKLRNILQAKGLRPMESVGKPFDPDMHEAITEIPVTDPSLEGKVVDEIEKGYYLNDKIIRFAKVVVGKQS